MRSDHALIDKIVQGLRSRGETVSFAESCTGGLLSSMITAWPGVSDVYMGSVVAYSNAVKTKLLSVSPTVLKTSGAVSLPVARAMANGIRKSIGTTWALSITGIAGPGGGTVTKPVGTVCVGIVGPGLDKAEQIHLTGSRQVIQLASAEHALRMLLSVVELA